MVYRYSGRYDSIYHGALYLGDDGFRIGVGKGIGGGPEFRAGDCSEKCLSVFRSVLLIVQVLLSSSSLLPPQFLLLDFVEGCRIDSLAM